MRIACVNCSTLYELDDRLIPPSGASVQCTRCGSVFTAGSGAAATQAPTAPQPSPLSQSSPRPRAGTQIFGAIKADLPASAGGARAATQIFGASLGTPASGKSDSPFADGAASPVATFSSSRSGGPRAASARTPVLSASPGVGVPDRKTAPVSRGTMIFGQPLVAEAMRAPAAHPSASSPLISFGPTAAAGEAAPNAANIPGETAARDAAATVKLPPEDPAWAASGRSQRRSGTVELPDAKPLFAADAPQTPGELAVEASGSRRVLVVALVVIAVAIPSYFAVRAVLKRRSAVPVEVLRGEESAMTLLRRDDRPSRKQAMAELDALANRYPTAVGPAATRLLALSLELDDVRLAVNHLQRQIDELKRSASRAAQDQRTAEVAAAQSQIAVLNGEIEPLSDEQKALDQQVATAFGALMTVSMARRGEEDAAAIRAQAVYYGVKNVDKAEGLARRYREFGAKDGWDAVALAEYALSGSASAALAAEARTESERSRSADSAFLRPYVLAARLALLQKDYDAASSLLEAVVALNPAHQMARELISWADEAKRNEPGRPAPAAGDPSAKPQ